MRSILKMPSDDMPESIANGRYLKKEEGNAKHL